MTSASPGARGKRAVDDADSPAAKPAAPARKRAVKISTTTVAAADTSTGKRPRSTTTSARARAANPTTSREAVETKLSVVPVYPAEPVEGKTAELVAAPEQESGRRRALVTGATSGIGLELARLLAADGFDLVMVARGKAALESVAQEIRGRHAVTVDVVRADLSDPKAPAAVAKRVRESGDGLDVLVNNAGYGVYGAFSATPLEDELAMLQLNISAVTALTKLLLPAVRARKGRILNVASTAAFQPGPFMAAYYASKAYVLHFTEALATELAGTGVTVTALCPGVVPTGFQDRAGVDGIALVKAPGVLSAEKVARKAYRGMMRGKRVVVPGGVNKLGVQMLRLAPRRVVTEVVKLLQAH
jgi:short-subunit dehydrogenase